MIIPKLDDNTKVLDEVIISNADWRRLCETALRGRHTTLLKTNNGLGVLITHREGKIHIKWVNVDSRTLSDHYISAKEYLLSFF